MALNGLVKKSIVAFSLATLLHAGLGDFIRNKLNGAVSTTSAGYYKTQAGGYWLDGGGVKVRWDLSGANINLFHAQAPSFAVGCNGIDATFGSFSYLWFDELVEKLKKISAAAPAMAFQMAITTMCEQCNTIMTNLEKISNALNNFNINACAASKGISRKMLNVIPNTGGATDATETRKNAKESPEWAFTEALEGYAKKFSSFGEEGFHNSLGHGSVLNKTLKTYSITFMDKNNFIGLMRALIGDIYGFDRPQIGSSGENETQIGKFLLFNPIIEIKDFLKVLKDGGEIKIEELTDNKDAKGHYLMPSLNVKSITIDSNSAFLPVFKQKIQKVIADIENKTLDDKDIKFVNSVPFPIYRFANLHATLRDEMSKEVAEYLAYSSMKDFVQKIFFEFMKTSGSLLQNSDYMATGNEYVIKWTKNVKKNYLEALKRLNDILAQKQNSLMEKERLIDKYQKIERQLVKNSAIWKSMGL